jgi:hypothetical protein
LANPFRVPFPSRPLQASDKGKPAERRGRRAEGLTLELWWPGCRKSVLAARPLLSVCDLDG